MKPRPMLFRAETAYFHSDVDGRVAAVGPPRRLYATVACVRDNADAAVGLVWAALQHPEDSIMLGGDARRNLAGTDRLLATMAIFDFLVGAER